MRALKLLPLLALVATSAFAKPRPPTVVLPTLQVGEHVLKGVLVSAAGTINNSSTATPFTLVAGTLLLIYCDAESFVTIGATASNVVTNANFGRIVPAKGTIQILLSDSTTQIAMFPTAAANCAVWQMQ